jgi:prepilin-type N-terminal cleavage/methylation domain-containing protein
MNQHRRFEAVSTSALPSIRRGAAAFTLIEMAIVLVIIGLIVGGVLVGQTLIKAAAIRNQIKQVQDLQMQINTFRTKYDCLPGDCANATTFFGTTFGSATIFNGDGDGFIRATPNGTTQATGDCLSTGCGSSASRQTAATPVDHKRIDKSIRLAIVILQSHTK